ncbi:unnamed protein product [Moneuplotes crassus]|uniref:Uncharacterized protein n=1 Tax=Euplotes crassus TaxID=5936 RepID=A0AAD1Y2S7_EUPCR|nr:unnamed protein product [Moneuplotes crassus]
MGTQEKRRRKYGQDTNPLCQSQKFGGLEQETMYKTRNLVNIHSSSPDILSSAKVQNSNRLFFRSSMLQPKTGGNASGRVYDTKRKSSIAKLNETWHLSDRKFLRTNVILSTESLPQSNLNLDMKFFRKSNPRVEFHLPADGVITQDDEIPDERTSNSGLRNPLTDDTYESAILDLRNNDKMNTQEIHSKYTKRFNGHKSRSNKYHHKISPEKRMKKEAKPIHSILKTSPNYRKRDDFSFQRASLKDDNPFSTLKANKNGAETSRYYDKGKINPEIHLENTDYRNKSSSITGVMKSSYELLKETDDKNLQNFTIRNQFGFNQENKLDRGRNSMDPFNKTQVIHSQVIDSKRLSAEPSYLIKGKAHPLVKFSQIDLNQEQACEEVKDKSSARCSQAELRAEHQEVKTYDICENEITSDPDERPIHPANNISVKIQICTQKHQVKRKERREKFPKSIKKEKINFKEANKSMSKISPRIQKEIHPVIKEQDSKTFLKKGSGHKYDPKEAIKESNSKFLKKAKSQACLSSSSKTIAMSFKEIPDLAQKNKEDSGNAYENKSDKRNTIFQKSLSLYKAGKNYQKKSPKKENGKLKKSKYSEGTNSATDLLQKTKNIPNPYNPEPVELKKNCSASTLKLSKRLREIRLNQHLEESVVAKTVASDIKSNDESSHASVKKKKPKFPYARYREIKRSLVGCKDDYGAKNTSKIENSLNSSPCGRKGVYRSYLAQNSSEKKYYGYAKKM